MKFINGLLTTMLLIIMLEAGIAGIIGLFRFIQWLI